jgi:GNAT superfamily N-acetyltransferase
MNITIRKVTEEDTNDLSKLFIEFYGTGSDTEKMKQVIGQMNANPAYYVPVACDSDKVVGTAMGIVCYDLCGSCNPFMLIEDVVVLPEYRNKGIGKMLMQALEDFGRQNKCKYVILVSEAERTSSHKFYERIGYPPGKEMGFKKKL